MLHQTKLLPPNQAPQEQPFDVMDIILTMQPLNMSGLSQSFCDCGEVSWVFSLSIMLLAHLLTAAMPISTFKCKFGVPLSSDSEEMWMFCVTACI